MYADRAISFRIYSGLGSVVIHVVIKVCLSGLKHRNMTLGSPMILLTYGIMM